MTPSDSLLAQCGELPLTLYAADSGGYDISGHIRLEITETGISLIFSEHGDSDWEGTTQFLLREVDAKETK